jgi:MscS family membrane protein
LFLEKPEIMLERVFYGNTLKEWGISLIIIVSALIINKLIVLLNRKVISKITSKTQTNLDDILFKSLESPILLGIILIAIWIATIRLDLGAKVHETVSKSYQILIVINITWFVVRFIGSLLEDYASEAIKNHKGAKAPADKKFKPLVKRIVMMFIWSIGIIMALSNAGVSIGALLGTLGIGGIAVALAVQDTVKNIIGGLTLFSDHPFKIGDRIQFDSIDGNVEDIGIRSTKIRTLDKRLLTIPNYKVVDAVIINVTGEPRRRVVVKLGLTYDTTPEKMKKAMEILKLMPEYVKDIDKRDLSATFSNFADSALIINYIYFIRKSSPDILESTSQVNLEILNRFNQEGLSFAFPTQTIYIEQEK